MQVENRSGIIAWFTRNPVAANLLMLGIFAIGIYSYFNINKKMFPEINPNSIAITVPLPGAAPAEVEQSVILKLEEAVEDIKGVKRMTSTAREGVGTLVLELMSGYSLSEKLDEVQMQVNAITTLPQEAEKPLVTKVEFESDVLWLSLFGNLDLRTRQELAKQIRDEIMQLDGVNIAEVVGLRPYEISVEISEQQLKKYNLSIDDIARAIRSSSIDLPAGAIKTRGGDIILRAKAQAYYGEEYANIVLHTQPDGTHLLLSDVAKVVDGFVESEEFSRFDRLPATNIRVRSTGDQNDLHIAAAVKAFVEKRRASLPEGVDLQVWGDSSYYLESRLDMMFSNLFMGAVLVFAILATFLRIRIAFWVMMGIPVCFLGAFIVMPMLGDWSVTINLLSLFAFIMVLGIVVDDAIVIGESVYSEIRERGHSIDKVIDGTHRVAVPATFGVLTTIAAFVPLLLIEGTFAGFFRSIAIVVSACLIFSLIESKWILPAHLAHMKYAPIDPENMNFIERYQRWFRLKLEGFITGVYRPWVEKAIRFRYTTLSIFIAALILSVGLIIGGMVKVEVFPNIPADFIRGSLQMVEGSPVTARNAALAKIEQAAIEIGKENEVRGGNNFVKHTLIFTEGDAGGGFLLELTKPEHRELTAFDIEKLWREKVGHIPGAKELRFYAGTNAGGGAALEFQLVGTQASQLEAAANELKLKLAEFDGVIDIRDNFSAGKQELQLKIKPQAEVLGLTQSDLARQVRQAFFGEEAQRIQRGDDELKVMVRYPEAQRKSLADLEQMWIRTADGKEVPFFEVADVELTTGYAAITRINQKRTISVMADIDSAKVESRKIIAEVNQKVLPEILKRYPGVKSGLEGASKDQAEFFSQLINAFIFALLLIYILIAVPTRSYGQPVVIMSVIPFGIIGAIIGHFILDRTINMLSMYGIIALTGVVVNDSLIMVDFVNKARARGESLLNAVLDSGSKRFRAILLTSLTTFFGVLPIYFETSLQAQFIIPMAISIGFGIMFATVITLFLIPSLYVILEDFKNLFRHKNEQQVLDDKRAEQAS